jgi:hypothetical protein
MRFSTFFIPFLTVVAGICGFWLRMIELATVFNPYTGFPERDAPITLALIGLSALIIVIAIIFAIRITVKYTVGSDFDNAFGTDSFMYPVIYTAVGTVWIAATAIYFLGHYAMGTDEILVRLFAGASSLAALFIIIFAIEVYKNPRRKFISIFSVLPTMFMCVWLVLIYRENASNPVLLSYAYKILGIAFAATGCYFSSSFAIGKPVIGKAIVAYIAATYFLFVTIADDYPMSMKMILSAIAFMSLFNLGSLLRNLQKKSRNRKKKHKTIKA